MPSASTYFLSSYADKPRFVISMLYSWCEKDRIALDVTTVVPRFLKVSR